MGIQFIVCGGRERERGRKVEGSEGESMNVLVYWVSSLGRLGERKEHERASKCV